MEEEKLSRRGFACRLAQAAVGGSIAARTLAWAQGGADGVVVVDLEHEDFAALRKVGGAVKVEVEGRDWPVIVVRVSEEILAAYSSKCTHWGCEVELPDELGIVRCPCHTSRFDWRGKLIDGQAQEDLHQVAVEIGKVSTAVADKSWGRIKNGQDKERMR